MQRRRHVAAGGDHVSLVSWMVMLHLHAPVAKVLQTSQPRTEERLKLLAIGACHREVERQVLLYLLWEVRGARREQSLLALTERSDEPARSCSSRSSSGRPPRYQSFRGALRCRGRCERRRRRSSRRLESLFGQYCAVGSYVSVARHAPAEPSGSMVPSLTATACPVSCVC